MLARRRANRVLNHLESLGREWRHPWTTIVRWSAEARGFMARIRPGFVNGMDVLAEGWQPDRSTKEMPLTDGPQMLVQGWRSVGADAESVSLTLTEEGEMQFGYEPVPEFFVAMGVAGSPTSAPLDVAATSRRLKAADLVLYKDRPGLATSPGTDGNIGVVAIMAPGSKQEAYVRIVRRHEQDAAMPDPLQQLLGNWADTKRDALHLATLWLLSPEDAADQIDETWQPFVEHKVFWNLSHDHNRQGLQPNVNPLVLQTGLAGGVGDLTIQDILASNNEQTQNALNFLANERIEGKFWSV